MSTKNKGLYRRQRIMRMGAFQDNLCFYCDEPLRYREPLEVFDPAWGGEPDQASFDHYISRDGGGSGRKENTVVAHRSCNTEKDKKVFEPGHPFDEKLRLLNIRRGYGDDEGRVDPRIMYHHLTPDAFGKDIPSLSYLCDLANESSQKDRDIVTRKLNSHRKLLRDTRVLENKGFRTEVIGTMTARRKSVSNIQLSSELLNTLLDNVIATMTKMEMRK